MIEIPEAFSRSTVEREGRAGAAWLGELAGIVEELLREDSEEFTHALPRHVVDAAVATVRELGRVQPEILVHGDLHAKNILRADRLAELLTEHP